MQTNRENLLRNPVQLEATQQFFVSNVGQLKDVIKSPPFMVRSLQWRIKVIPGDWALGFYVQCLGRNNSPNWSCNANIELRLLSNQPFKGPAYVKGPFRHLFKAEEDDYGYGHFIRWQNLLHMANAYMICGGILLEARVIADVPQGLDN